MTSLLRLRVPTARKIARRVPDLAAILLISVVALSILYGQEPAPAAPAPEGSPCQGSWPQYRFEPGLTGFNPCETVVGPENVSGLSIKWQQLLGPGGTGIGQGLVSPPTVVDGVIYQHSQYGNLFAIDAATGQVLWTAATGGYGSSQPAVVDGVVYVGTVYGVRAYPVSCSTPCEPLWVAEQDMTFNPPVVVADSVVYAAGYDGRIRAVDAATGNLLWSAAVNTTVDPLFAAPAVANGLVYVPGNLGLYVYRAQCTKKNCEPVWFRKTDYSLQSSPAVADGVVYAASTMGTLYAWDAREGTPLMKEPTAPLPQAPAVADGMVFLATAWDGILWAFPAGGCRGHDCAPAWKTTFGGQALYEPVVANGVVYVGTLDYYYVYGNLLAYPTHCSEGCAPLWSHPVTGAVEWAPTVVNGTLYAGTMLGILYAFSLPAP